MAFKNTNAPIFRGSKRNKVYMDAKDKNVSRTIIYINNYDENVSADLIPYADEAGTRMLSPDELLDAFIKGAVASIRKTDGSEIVATLLSVEYNVNLDNGATWVIVKCVIDGKTVGIMARRESEA